MITELLSLKKLLSLREPRDRLARWVLEIQDSDFEIVHAKGSHMVVPDILSRDAVLKPLCQRCYNPLQYPNPCMRGNEDVQRLRESDIAGAGPSIELMHDEQSKEFCDLSEYARENESMLLNENCVL